MDLLYDRISLCKVPRATKLIKQGRSDRSNVQTCDVTHVLQSAMIGPPKSWRMDPKRYGQSPRPSLRVFILKELNTAEGEVWFRD